MFLRTFDVATGSLTVTGTDGIDSSAYGENGDDVIRTFGGNDIIKDFHTGLDLLDFTEFNGTPTASLSHQGGNTVIGVGDVTVTLEGVSASALNADNFLGVNLDGFAEADEFDIQASSPLDDSFLI